MERSNDSGFGSLGSSGVSSGGIAMGAVPDNTWSGDIVVSSNEKKPRKGLLVGVVIALAALVIGGVVAVMILGGHKNESVLDKFNKLINFVVSGEESTTSFVGTYSNESVYYFDEQQLDLNKRTALYGKTAELLNGFMAAYDGLANKDSFSSNSERFATVMRDEKAILTFASIVHTKKIPSIFDVSAVLQEEGESEVVGYYSNYYDYSGILDNKYINDYKPLFEQYINYQIEIVKIYSEMGCLSGNTIMSGCIENSDNGTLLTRLNTLNEDLKKVEVKVEYYYNISDYFVVQLFSAYDYVNSKATSFVWREGRND